MAERVSAVALVPLTLWFVASIIPHTSSDYATFIAWLRTPVVAILMILLLSALFHHTAVGLQVVIEDYVHSGVKFAAVIGVRLACFALAAAGIVAKAVRKRSRDRMQFCRHSGGGRHKNGFCQPDLSLSRGGLHNSSFIGNVPFNR